MGSCVRICISAAFSRPRDPGPYASRGQVRAGAHHVPARRQPTDQDYADEHRPVRQFVDDCQRGLLDLVKGERHVGSEVGLSVVCVARSVTRVAREVFYQASLARSILYFMAGTSTEPPPRRVARGQILAGLLFRREDPPQAPGHWLCALLCLPASVRPVFCPA